MGKCPIFGVSVNKDDSNLSFRGLISRVAKLTDFDLVFKGAKPAATINVDCLFPGGSDCKVGTKDIPRCEFLTDPKRENIIWVLTHPRPITKSNGLLFVFNTKLINPIDHLDFLFNFHKLTNLRRSTTDSLSDVEKIQKIIYDYHLELGTMLGYPPLSVKIFAKEMSDGVLRKDRIIVSSGKNSDDNVAFIAYPESLDEAIEAMKEFRRNSRNPKSKIRILNIEAEIAKTKEIISR